MVRGFVLLLIWFDYFLSKKINFDFVFLDRYCDKGITINSSGVTNCFEGIIHGVADYPIATTVLLKIQTGSGDDYYVNFNAKRGINWGTQ